MVVMSRAALKEGALRFEGWELQKGFAGTTTHDCASVLPIFDNDQDMAALAARVSPVLEKDPTLPGFFLAGHGLYAFGRSVAEAKRHVEVVEALLVQLQLWRSLS